MRQEVFFRRPKPLEPEAIAHQRKERLTSLLEALRQDLQGAEAAANLAKGRAEQRAATLQSVVEAEEDLDSSKAELKRITRLAAILDKTVQSDTERKIAILQVLHLLSKDRQVILFTQEDDVLSWAERNLVGANDRVERLQ